MTERRTEYYIDTNNDGEEAIFHIDDKDNPVSNWYSEVLPYGLVCGESKYYYNVMRHDGKEAIFYVNDKDEPVSDWHTMIYPSGLIKDESIYYIVMRDDDKQAIFNLSDKYTPVSNWHDAIDMHGLIMGESEFYATIDFSEERRTVYHVRDKDNPVDSTTLEKLCPVCYRNIQIRTAKEQWVVFQNKILKTLLMWLLSKRKRI